MRKDAEPKCEQCGRPRSAHNILSLTAPAGVVRNGPYVDLAGNIFCRGYQEAA